MNLSDIAKRISTEYATARSEELKGHELARIIASESRGAIPEFLLGERYIVKGSSGQGNWALIPWIAIFDKDLSVSATEGFYIVLLFTSDYTGFYLSLNQGWTFYDKNFGSRKKETCVHVSKYWQNELTTLNRSDGFTTDPINLRLGGIVNSSLGRGYEYGNIYSKYFDVSASLLENEVLAGIEHLKSALNELKSLLPHPGQSLQKNIETILSIPESELITKQDLESAQGQPAIALIESLPPKSTRIFTRVASDNAQIRKIDFVEKQRNNLRLGNSGEELILEYEKKLAMSNALLAKYVNEIKHVSKTDDSLGYDIESIREQPSGTKVKIYIEVKTTKGSINTPFFISQNEIDVSDRLGKSYYICRIYNIDASPPGFYYVQGPLSTSLLLKPVTYLAFPNS